MTGGKSLEANKALIENNAATGAKIAVELSKMNSGLRCVHNIYKSLDAWGPSINDVQFFGPFFDLPLSPCLILSLYKFPILLYGVRFW